MKNKPEGFSKFSRVPIIKCYRKLNFLFYTRYKRKLGETILGILGGIFFLSIILEIFLDTILEIGFYYDYDKETMITYISWGILATPMLIFLHQLLPATMRVIWNMAFYAIIVLGCIWVLRELWVVIRQEGLEIPTAIIIGSLIIAQSKR